MSEEKRNRRPSSRRHDRPRPDDKNIKKMLSDLETKLQDSLEPETLSGLNSFERKLVHRHFDHNPDYETRTYRDGDNYKLMVYPVGNLERFAQEKAQESVDHGDEVALPPMGSYERFVVHNALKEFAGVETSSAGEGPDRHVTIQCKKFGRGLKRIAKKIRLI